MSHSNQQDIDVMFLPDYASKTLDSGKSAFMAIATGRDLRPLIGWLKDQTGSPGRYTISSGYNNNSTGMKQIYIKFKFRAGDDQFNAEVKGLAQFFKLTWYNKQLPVNR